jgi:hypothetical protein
MADDDPKLQRVRDAIADRFSTIDGLRGLKTIPSEITPPAVAIEIESIDYDTTMDRGSDDVTWVATLFESKTSERVSQDRLFAYMSGAGPKSVKAAFEANTTLGGLVFDVSVAEARQPGTTPVGAIEYNVVQFVLVSTMDSA